MVHHRPGHVFRPGSHPGANFRHHRLQRGFFVHPFWFGPQFHVQNWQLYGFAPPPRHHRWVRFYDDAYLIDRDGRVRDHRYDFDWERHGEHWERRDGIPYHAAPEGRVHHRDDWEEEEEFYADGPHHRPLPPPPLVCGPGPHFCAGAPTYAYPGYGYGVMYPPIIIETTTTTTGGCCEQVAEEVVHVRQHRQRRHRPRAVRPRPRPPSGERG
jgi:hypothetical protein